MLVEKYAIGFFAPSVQYIFAMEFRNACLDVAPKAQKKSLIVILPTFSSKGTSYFEKNNCGTQLELLRALIVG